MSLTHTSLLNLNSLNVFEVGIIALSITAIMAYINKRWIGLPTTIGVMAISLSISLVAISLSFLGFQELLDFQIGLLKQMNFTDVLLDGMLSMLLFAGALHINLDDLRKFKLPIALLACGGTILSALLIAAALYFMLPIFGFNIGIIWCLLFGALISPTDPIAVLGILKSVGAPRSLNTVIAGESLFNDGVGVVLFTMLIGTLYSGDMPTVLHIGHSFAWEAMGGLLFGCVLGYIIYYMIKTIDSHHEEVLLTLAGVLGGYTLANLLHFSAPLAMVTMGLVMGNRGRTKAMSVKSRHYVDLFWELIDEILNAILFMLIGLEIVTVAYNYSSNLLLVSLATIALVLLARISITGLITRRQRDKLGLPVGSWKVLTWGGLRGGISVALVLQLPAGMERDLLLSLTYAIVVFSILVQGMTVRKVVESVKLKNANLKRNSL